MTSPEEITHTESSLVYVAGPYRAESTYEIRRNIHRAEEVSAALWAHGVYNVCPHKAMAHLDGVAGDDILSSGTLEMLRRCDAVVLVSGWKRSVGSLREVAHAIEHSMPVYENVDKYLSEEPIGFRYSDSHALIEEADRLEFLKRMGEEPIGDRNIIPWRLGRESK